MTVTDKDFRVKHGLNVAGDATFASQVILGSTPLAFDTNTNRLQLFINDSWQSVAMYSDLAGVLNFMDIALTIDYNGQPVYIVQGNGVNILGDSKFVDGGSPTTATTDYIFDSGIITV